MNKTDKNILIETLSIVGISFLLAWNFLFVKGSALNNTNYVVDLIKYTAKKESFESPRSMSPAMGFAQFVFGFYGFFTVSGLILDRYDKKGFRKFFSCDINKKV